MGFRDADIKYITEDAIAFFSDTFGLDFSAAPNEMNERFFENARMAPYMLSNEHKMYANTNNWIRTGSTRTTCNRMFQGGFRVTFSGDQTLYGSYGGAEGKPAGVVLLYGFYSIDGCQQSPVVIQFQCSKPPRIEPVDGVFIFNCESYSRVLGYGRIRGNNRSHTNSRGTWSISLLYPRCFHISSIDVTFHIDAETSDHKLNT